MNIFVAAMLRSGSIHINRGLCYLLGYRPENVIRIDGEGQGEQNINPFRMMTIGSRNNQVISGHHCAYADVLMQLEVHKIKPIVVIRNLADTLVSAKEKIDYYGIDTVLPDAHIGHNWETFNDEQKYVWLAYNVGQWQQKFIVTWIDAESKKTDMLWVQYEEFYINQRVGFQRILDFYGLGPVDNGRMATVENCLDNNFNIGIVGRGARLPHAAKRILDDQAHSWGKVYEQRLKEFLF